MLLLTLLLQLNLNKFSVFFSFFILIGSIFYLNGDTVYYILISLMFMYLLNGNLNIVKNLIAIVLSLLSLSKGMFLLLSFVIIIFYILINLNKENYRKSIIFFLTYILGLSFFWILSNQNFSNLPQFIYGIFTFSLGYNEAMSIFESLPMTISGFSVFILALLNYTFLFFLSLNLEKRQKILYFFFLIFEGFLFFIVWKHGFVRADEHINIFFKFVILNNLLILGFTKSLFSKSNLIIKGKLFKLIKINLITISIISLVTISVVDRLSPVELASNKIDQMKSSFIFYFSPTKSYENLKQNLSFEKKSVSLPDIKNIVRNSSISYFGMLPGYAIQNEFNYKTSPATISFASFNEAIMKKEAQFYSNEIKIPDYILYDLQTIDDRLIAQDNSLAKLEILKRYNILGYEKGMILLKKNNKPTKFKKEIINSKQSAINKWISVPEYKKNIIWLNIKNNNESYSSKIFSLFYKPPKYLIKIKFDDGTIQTYKLILNMAKAGFMISPIIFNHLDYYYLEKFINDNNLHNIYQKKISDIMITCQKLTFACSKELKVTFSSLQFKKEIHEKLYFEASHWKLPDTAKRKIIENDKNHKDSFVLTKDIIFNKNKKNTKLILEYGINYQEKTKNNFINIIINKIKGVFFVKKPTINIQNDVSIPKFFINFINKDGQKKSLYKETVLLKDFENQSAKIIQLILPTQSGIISIETNQALKAKNYNLFIKQLDSNFNAKN